MFAEGGSGLGVITHLTLYPPNNAVLGCCGMSAAPTTRPSSPSTARILRRVRIPEDVVACPQPQRLNVFLNALSSSASALTATLVTADLHPRSIWPRHSNSSHVHRGRVQVGCDHSLNSLSSERHCSSNCLDIIARSQSQSLPRCPLVGPYTMASLSLPSQTTPSTPTHMTM